MNVEIKITIVAKEGFSLYKGHEYILEFFQTAKEEDYIINWFYVTILRATEYL